MKYTLTNSNNFFEIKFEYVIAQLEMFFRLCVGILLLIICLLFIKCSSYQAQQQRKPICVFPFQHINYNRL